MPHRDKRSGEIVLRIVYDGFPEAGKTTNIHVLTEQVGLTRREKSASPGTTGRRTEFFDWLDFSGGYVDGSRIRCQLVSVPGQPSLLRRRRYLLKTADSVVFVADSSPDLIEDNCKSFALLRSAIASSSDGAPVGIVLQANKQDVQGALSPMEIRKKMRLDEEIEIVPATAVTGDGVSLVFSKAVGLAVARVREMLLRGELHENGLLAETPHDLHEALLALEKPVSARVVKSMGKVSPAGAVSLLPTNPRTTAAATIKQTGTRRHPKTIANELDIRVPDSGIISPDNVWPSPAGLATLEVFNAPGTRRQKSPVAWAGHGAVEWCSSEGWLIHTRRDWVFADRAGGRAYLLQMLTRRQPLRRPKGQSFLLEEEAKSWRMWAISPSLVTVEDRVRAALRDRDESGMTKVLEQVIRLDIEYRRSGEFPGLEGICLQDGHLVFMEFSPMEASVVTTLAALRIVVVELMHEGAHIGDTYHRAVARVKQQHVR